MKLREFALTEMRTLHEALFHYACRDNERTKEQASHEMYLLHRVSEMAFAAEQELLANTPLGCFSEVNK